MQLTVLGGCGVWPEAGSASSGYLVETGTYILLIDPGYATLPQLLRLMPAESIDVTLVSHGHPDHCADLNPLLPLAPCGTARRRDCPSTHRVDRWPLS